MLQLKQSRHPVIGIALSAVALGTLGACGDWPRYKNKPSTDASALEPDADPAQGITVAWADPSPETEPNDTPGEATEMALLEGIMVDGILTGLGWDPDIEVDRISTCGEGLAFPPDAPGSYTGDVDWIVLDPKDEGVLCMRLTTDEIDARLDAVLYTLDACGDPTALFVHPEDETPIGSNRQAGASRWAISVERARPLAIGIAGFWPDDDEVDLPWSIQLALVPAVSGSADALCPESQ